MATVKTFANIDFTGSGTRQPARGHVLTYDTKNLRQQLVTRLGEARNIYPRHLEQQFPHVLATMIELWGSTRMASYLDGLMMTDRPNRQGFPAEVVTEIFRISVIHRGLERTQQAPTFDWFGVASREGECRGYQRN